MLTKTEIKNLLELLRWETVYESTLTKPPVRMTVSYAGYAGDGPTASLQAKLSVMLAAAPDE